MEKVQLRWFNLGGSIEVDIKMNVYTALNRAYLSNQGYLNNSIYYQTLLVSLLKFSEKIKI